jgi:hypothetical protein
MSVESLRLARRSGRIRDMSRHLLPVPAVPAVSAVSDGGPLLDGCALTQYGQLISVPPFRQSPRFDSGETDISLLEGRLEPSEAAALVLRRAAPPYATVRYTTVGRLRLEGFIVTRTPTRRVPNHISVTVPSLVEAWHYLEVRRFERAFRGGE